jgi:hypothetical protein
MQQFRFGPRDVLAAALVSVWLVALPQGSSENCDRLVSGGFGSCRWLTRPRFIFEQNREIVPASDCLRHGMKTPSCAPSPSVLPTLNQHRGNLGLESLTRSPLHLRGGCTSDIGDGEPSSVQVEESLDEDQVGLPTKNTQREYTMYAHITMVSHSYYKVGSQLGIPRL